MLRNQRISAHAGKLRIAVSRSIRIAGAATFVAVALLPIVPAHGSEGQPPQQPTTRTVAPLPLPAIPYFEKAPWLSWPSFGKGLKVDTLQLPRSPLDGTADEDISHQQQFSVPVS